MTRGASCPRVPRRSGSCAAWATPAQSTSARVTTLALPPSAAGRARRHALLEERGRSHGCPCPHRRTRGLSPKPQDFMNTSGGPLSKLMRQEHVTPQILVVHDEVDLPAERCAQVGGGLTPAMACAHYNKLGTRTSRAFAAGIGRPERCRWTTSCASSRAVSGRVPHSGPGRDALRAGRDGMPGGRPTLAPQRATARPKTCCDKNLLR